MNCPGAPRSVPSSIRLWRSQTRLWRRNCTFHLQFQCYEWTMDYSYLNQAAAAAAAGFEASSCALAASEMQCGYGDLSSCSQMSQAAYRYTAARAAGYPGNAGTTSTGSTTPLGAHHTTHSHAHAHHGAHATPCSVMAARSQEVHRHAASIFPSAINLQSEYPYVLLQEEGNGLWRLFSGWKMCFVFFFLFYSCSNNFSLYNVSLVFVLIIHKIIWDFNSFCFADLVYEICRIFKNV